MIVRKPPEGIKILALASSMGFSVALAIVIGLAIGYYLDGYFGTRPWLTLIFLILGIVAGFRNIIILLRRVQKMEKDSKGS